MSELHKNSPRPAGEQGPRKYLSASARRAAEKTTSLLSLQRASRRAARAFGRDSRAILSVVAEALGVSLGGSP